MAVSAKEDGPATSHWANVAPTRPKLPTIGSHYRAADPIDRFVVAKLLEKKLRPAAPASLADQLRRVTLDLTGLPPTVDELDAFLADRSPDAYQRVVDRLLASPRLGERMAQDWLDLARYGDTHGYHADTQRDMWRWRDWVIEALNRNQPYDKFTIEQLAGDLLPQATLAQRIATGFNRNHLVNHENGAIPEEYRTEYVMDRTVTTAAVWLGQTWGCARCHDHKYDPISQRDFYRLFAYFNNVPENGLDGREGNAVPFIAAPTTEQEQQLASLAKQIASLKDRSQRRAATCDDDFAAWRKKQTSDGSARLPPGGVAAWFSLDETPDQSISDAATPGPAAKVHGQTSFVNAKFGQGLLFDGETHVELGDMLPIDRDLPFTVSVWMFPTSGENGTLLARVDDAFTARGLTLAWEERRLIVRLRNEMGTDEIVVATTDQWPLRKWQHVAATYDGSGKAAGLKLFVDGKQPDLVVQSDSLIGAAATRRPWLLGRRDKEDPWRGMLDEVRLYARGLSPDDVALLAGGDPLRQLLATPFAKLSKQDADQLCRYYLEHYDADFRKLQADLAAAMRDHERLQAFIPTTMVMQEMLTPRETFVLERGLYNHPQEKVTPGVPEQFLKPSPGLPENRLGLARWLVERRHPLTARVAVNRYWAHFFGRGLVSTPEDFGVRGAPPSHPELLDYLAVEFMESGWDVKHIVRLIVTSDTYRQSAARQTGDDPENVWLARGPQIRLPAEAIRDRALFVSGLLCEHLGGPSVNPHQPADLWKDLAYDVTSYSAQSFKEGRGSDLVRRSLYTFWKRTAPHPLLASFDAPNRETCTAQRPRTNSPAQALALLNDATMLEAARSLAKQLVAGRLPDAMRVDELFHIALSRAPSKTERERLLRLLRDQSAAFVADREAVQELAGSDSAELAAWITVVQVVFNLEEFVMN
jgi:hypothetical protein